MSDKQAEDEIADRMCEVAALRERGYSAAEIAALLSSDKWLGNAIGSRFREDMQLSRLLRSDEWGAVCESPVQAGR